MDSCYDELADELLKMRASQPQLKVERKMSKMVRGEIMALNYLAVNGHKAYPKDLSESLLLTTARIAAILKSLEKQKLITRTPDPNDNRQTIVELTDSGCAVVEKHHKEMKEHVAKTLSFLGEKDAKEYIRIQKKLLELGTFWR